MERVNTIYPDFDCVDMTFLEETKQVFIAGSGPAIIVMHEIPGLYPKVADFARKLVNEGFRVYMPSLIGKPGKPYSIPYNVSSIARACVSKEFTMWATNRKSPIVDWLRQLAKHAFDECGGPGVGAIGMCLTGGFALGMMVDDFVIAPVLSQPSLPIAVTHKQKQDIGLDSETLEKVKSRAEEGVCVMGLRFTGDRLVPAERFGRLRKELGDKFISVEIDSSWGNPHKLSPISHSVLAFDYVDKEGHPTKNAYHQVLDFFSSRLFETETSAL